MWPVENVQIRCAHCATGFLPHSDDFVITVELGFLRMWLVESVQIRCAQSHRCEKKKPDWIGMQKWMGIHGVVYANSEDNWLMNFGVVIGHIFGFSINFCCHP